MKDIKKRYEEAKAAALRLMTSGNLSSYIQKLGEAEHYRLQLVAVSKR